jgi:ubiquinone/menaquinone biosynthesis C-methylase UbiE
VSGEILKLPDASLPDEMYAADISPKMIEMLRAKAQRGANLSGHPDSYFTHSFTNFGIIMFPDAENGPPEVYRTLRRAGGAATITTWEKLGYMHLFYEAQQAVQPDIPELKGPLPAEWLTKAKLKQVMEAGGFQATVIESNPARCVRSGGRGWKTMTGSVSGMITTGLAEADKERFWQELEKGFAESEEKNTKVEMTLRG